MSSKPRLSLLYSGDLSLLLMLEMIFMSMMMSGLPGTKAEGLLPLRGIPTLSGLLIFDIRYSGHNYINTIHLKNVLKIKENFN